uniref:Uncharacterized protein n=1 Tax=Terrapene triunguis TaxID=2587831 RepID=A0A674JDF0_9SAUR
AALPLPGERGKGSYPKPSISVSPGGVIPMGANVTIWCWHQHLGMRIQLYKAGAGNYLNYTDPAGSEAEFPITSARREHGGSYTCRYSNRTDPAAYSEPSDPVQIIVAGEGPSPASPAPHPARSPGARTAGPLRARLYLNLQRQMDPAGDGAEFLIPTVGRQHGGSYSCSYRPRSEPFVSSQPSDPLQLVVAGESPGGHSTDGALGARLCPEPWSQQRRCPAGERGRSHCGVPQPGGAAAASGDLGLREGRSLPLSSL